MATRRRGKKTTRHTTPAVNFAALTTPMLLVVLHSRLIHLSVYGHPCADHGAVVAEVKARGLL